MKAIHSDLLKFLQGEQQFRIPLYQRTYNWETKHCQKLLDDIIKVANDESRPNHFFGSIVYVEPDTTNKTDVDQLLVIDGQQRLTTITLLLFTISQVFLKKQSTVSGNPLSRIEKKYLINPDVEDEDKKYKLILTKSDKETLNNIIAGTPDSDEFSQNIRNNLKFFTKSIEDNDFDLEMLYSGISKLKIVDITLEKGDNPQLIFESLNSTGLELSQADLIRNFLLMGLELDEQNELYNKFWYPMERSMLGSTNTTEDFDRFMKDFLTIKQITIPVEREVYNNFKEYYVEENISNSEYVKELNRYSKFFEIVALQKSDDKEIKAAVYDINELRVKPAYPFLMQVLSDYDEKIISKDDVLEIMNVIQSYVFRRQHTPGTQTHGHDKTFATLYGMIEKEHYVDSVKAGLLSKERDKRFPSDEEFFNSICVAEVYNMRSCKYLLLKLENSMRKDDKENISDVTIEHIMPQNENLSQEWIDELGPNWRDIQSKTVHGLGNLTITELNSEMSDNSFQKKKEIAFNNSPFYLSADLRQLEHWNQDEIEKRTKKLAKLALEVWKYPTVSNESLLQKFKTDDEVEDDDDDDPRAKDGWNYNRSKSSPEIIQGQDELIKKIHEKFDCVSKPHRWFLYFYTKEPMIQRNLFLVMNCRKTTFNVFYQIHPETYSDNDNLKDEKGKPKIRKNKGSYFFRQSTKESTERRIRVTADDFPLVLEQLDHAYQITQEEKNYKTKS